MSKIKFPQHNFLFFNIKCHYLLRKLHPGKIIAYQFVALKLKSHIYVGSGSDFSKPDPQIWIW